MTQEIVQISPSATEIPSVLTVLNEKTWQKFDFARNAAGQLCYATDPKALKFCLWGAIERVYGGDNVKITQVMNKCKEHPKFNLFGPTCINDMACDWNTLEKLIKEAGI